MATPQYERFFARILIGFKEGGTLCYVYNRESLDEVFNIKREEYDKSQFIEIGNILTFNGHKYKVVEINFKLEDHLNKMDHGYGINVYGLTEPTDFNCQIGVFVDKID